MELIFTAVFLATALLIGAASLIITEKLKDLFKAGAKETKYILSIISCALVTMSVKYLGVSATWGLLSLVGGGGTELPAKPEMPQTGTTWFYWLCMIGLSWFMSSGLYDYIKSLLKTLFNTNKS